MERAAPKVAEWKLAADERASLPVHEALTKHLRDRFRKNESWLFGPRIREWTLATGPQRLPPDFRVLEIPSAKGSNVWMYVSIGAFAGRPSGEPMLEFMLLTSGRQTERGVELLTMTAYYHAKHLLGLGHTFPLGEPWLPGATCDSALISLPYTLGPEFEICHVGERHVHIYWMLPITTAERRFRHEHGLDELEQHFEEASLDYVDPLRNSVV